MISIPPKKGVKFWGVDYGLITARTLPVSTCICRQCNKWKEILFMQKLQRKTQKSKSIFYVLFYTLAPKTLEFLKCKCNSALWNHFFPKWFLILNLIARMYEQPWNYQNRSLIEMRIFVYCHITFFNLKFWIYIFTQKWNKILPLSEQMYFFF